MNNKHIVITGGSKGLGLDCTRSLLEQGAQVYVLSRSQGQLQPLLDSYADNLHWFATDLGDAGSIANTFAGIVQLTSRLDAMILNAALTTPMQLSDMTPDQVDQNLQVNIAGPIACLRESLPLLKNGRAVFISSESVVHPFPMLSLYAAVKAAVETLLNGLRSEMLTQHNIQLTTLRAGHMAGTAFSESWPPEALEKFFTLSQQSGNLGSSGTPMPVARVVSAIEFILSLPVDACVNTMDLRSGDGV